MTTADKQTCLYGGAVVDFAPLDQPYTEAQTAVLNHILQNPSGISSGIFNYNKYESIWRQHRSTVSFGTYFYYILYFCYFSFKKTPKWQFDTELGF